MAGVFPLIALSRGSAGIGQEDDDVGVVVVVGPV